MNCSLPGSSVPGILQARILEWVAISSSRGSSRPRDQLCVSCVSYTGLGFLITEPPGMPRTLTYPWNLLFLEWELVLLYPNLWNSWQLSYPPLNKVYFLSSLRMICCTKFTYFMDKHIYLKIPGISMAFLKTNKQKSAIYSTVGHQFSLWRQKMQIRLKIHIKNTKKIIKSTYFWISIYFWLSLKRSEHLTIEDILKTLESTVKASLSNLIPNTKIQSF